MDIIYAVCSWGLGHATRSLPIIRRLLDEQHNLTIISDGRPFELLRKELGTSVQYYAVPDYPMLLSDNSRQFLAKSIIYWPVFIKRIEAGLIHLQKILNQQHCDRIVSDARYDMYSKHIPSFFISHQMRIMNPLRIRIFESGSEVFNKFFFKRFKGILIPDYIEDDLSGDLSHNLKRIDEKKLHYIGILSDFKQKKVQKKIDYLISLSGPEPQRGLLEQKILKQIPYLKGNIALTLGKTEANTLDKHENISIYSYLGKVDREHLMNQARMIISRSGYSTIMDLAVLHIKAVLIPTPGQIEQEYLGQYHTMKNTFYSTAQDKLDLQQAVNAAENTTGITRICNVKKSVENAVKIIMDG
ncbi:MAG: glycosyltransferase [Candidatus Thermoplasmatota archaeon]|nr:glycosyltransferase [Candidatus Thermoplasmatota archaeon]MBU1940536.1 glycosyltransferase [Candidatus Thermoplasmatota archaeon]